MQLVPRAWRSVGNIVAGTSVHLEAGGAIDADDITAGTFIEMLAGGNVDFGALIAGTFIDASAGGNLTGGNLLGRDVDRARRGRRHGIRRRHGADRIG